MKLPEIKQFKWNYLALAFAVPVVGIAAMLIICGCEPFGDRSLLYSDMYHQYYPFFVEFREAILSGESLLYNWTIGMGLDFLGLYAYYLASPLNLLSVLVPEDLLLEYFSLLMPIKLGLASLFFAIFLKKTFQKDDLSITLFGAFYGLCAWALGFQWNIMWLDTFALLPLVALGTVSLLRDKKFFLYTVTLFLSIYTNYYIGLFTCIFVFLLFFCYEICRFKGFRRFFEDLFRIALFSALAIGMTAILSLPTLAALRTTQSSVNNFPTGFRLNIATENTWKGLLDAMRQVAGNVGGGLTPNFKEGLPNLYCGVGTVILAFLFLTAKQIKLRDKICSVFLLMFFMVSFIIRQLDYIWHGFHFTNMIPYRFSFLFSFVMLYMAYRAYLLRRQFKPWQIIVSAVLAAAMLACSDSRTDPVFITYNLTFLILYVSLFLYTKLPQRISKDMDPEEIHQQISTRVRNRQIAALILGGIMVLELAFNIVNFSVNFSYTSVSNYPQGTTYTASMIRYMKEREEDNLFYRAEVTHAQTLNDSALNHYNGISTFTSSANVKVTEFMRSLGYGALNTYNRYCYEESSPISNLFLGIKYMIERSGQVEPNSYFTDLHHYGSVHLLENNAYLPLGFLAETDLAELSFKMSGDSLNFQNRLMLAATGIRGNYWTLMSGDLVTAEGVGVEITGTATGHAAHAATETGGTITFTYRPETEGFMCLYLNLPQRNSYTVILNGKELYQESYSIPQTIAVCDVVPGDVVEVRFTCKASDEKGSITAKGYLLDEKLFWEAYDVLSASTLELTSFSNTRVEGTIDCNRDGLLYTSIPQNGNWYVEVDGKPAEISLVADVMIGVQLTEGSHTVTFVYKNAAFSLGWKITLACVLLFGAITYFTYLPGVKRGKYEKRK